MKGLCKLNNSSNKVEASRLLEALEAVVTVLKERFGPNTSLAELSAAIPAHTRMLRGGPVSVSSIAQQSGLSKSTISAMVNRREYLRHGPHQEDTRRKVITFDDAEERLAYLHQLQDALAILDTEPA